MRDKKEFIGINRNSISSQFRAIADSIVKPAPTYDMNGLIGENKLSWVFKNICNLGNTHYTPYPTYTDEANGIFGIQKNANETTTIALLSDWASDTAESQHIATQVGTNDYSIHLGDTYYVGNDKEIASNFNTQQGGSWPYGTLGSFVMLGNHEMYSSGKSYFEQLLPVMGNYAGNKQVQQASFFCLQNDYWRIIGLDTGYDSLTGWLGVKDNTDLDLPDVQKDWLQNKVNINGDNRGIIILSHHQLFSAFEGEYPNPGKFISTLVQPGRDIIWLWGHEHWFSVYGPNKLDNGSNVFARCIGNSGMPVELIVDNGAYKVPKSANINDPVNHNLVLYDNRLREHIDGSIPLGHNGYTTLNLGGPKLVISYYDDNDMQPQSRKILEEEWEVDITTGKLTGNSITDLTLTSDFPLNSFAGDLNKAIGAPLNLP